MISGVVSLRGHLIELQPLEWNHVPALMVIARGAPTAFALTSTPRTEEEANAYFGEAMRLQSAGTTRAFVLRKRGTQEIVGTTRLYDIDLRNRRCSIGFTWLDPAVHGDGSNTEAKYLLLRLAFNEWAMNRVQFQVDERNGRSQAALRRLGAQEEGRLRLHMLASDGSYRTTIVFSILAPDWPSVRTQLEQRLLLGLAGSSRRS